MRRLIATFVFSLVAAVLGSAANAAAQGSGDPMGYSTMLPGQVSVDSLLLGESEIPRLVFVISRITTDGKQLAERLAGSNPEAFQTLLSNIQPEWICLPAPSPSSAHATCEAIFSSAQPVLPLSFITTEIDASLVQIAMGVTSQTSQRAAYLIQVALYEDSIDRQTWVGRNISFSSIETVALKILDVPASSSQPTPLPLTRPTKSPTPIASVTAAPTRSASATPTASLCNAPVGPTEPFQPTVSPTPAIVSTVGTSAGATTNPCRDTERWCGGTLCCPLARQCLKHANGTVECVANCPNNGVACPDTAHCCDINGDPKKICTRSGESYSCVTSTVEAGGRSCRNSEGTVMCGTNCCKPTDICQVKADGGGACCPEGYVYDAEHNGCRQSLGRGCGVREPGRKSNNPCPVDQTCRPTTSLLDVRAARACCHKSVDHEVTSEGRVRCCPLSAPVYCKHGARGRDGKPDCSTKGCYSAGTECVVPPNVA